MLLTPETQQRIDQAIKAADLYMPNAATNAQLQTHSLIELIAPAAESKSTIMDEAAALDPDLSYVSGFTTRTHEDRDVPGRYAYFTSEEEINGLLDRIDQRSVAQYAGHPTTGKLYGSFPEDYHTDFALLDALFNSVDDLDRLAFKSIFKVAVVSRGNEWEERFVARYPESSNERMKRAHEAILCLEWIIAQDANKIIWLENTAGHATKAAKQLIAMTKYGQPSESLRPLAEEMLEKAKKIAA